MTLDIAVVIFVLVLILLVLSTTRISPDFVFLGFLAILLLFPKFVDGKIYFGILTPSEALTGFSNPGMITVAFLYIVARGLRNTGAIDYLGNLFLNKPKGLRGTLTRVVFPVVGLSAFLNNTPVVSMMIPVLSDLAKRMKLHVSKLMIPLSYAAILGGTCTLIGTSTNLVVNGMMLDSVGKSLNIFDITLVGLPCALIGCLFLILVGPKLLPERGSATSTFDNPREYTVEMIVEESSNLVGKSIQEAGLRNLPSIYLVGVTRGEQIVPAVGPDYVLKANDRLLFAGVVDSVKELQNFRGLVPATDQLFKLGLPRYRRQLFEAVISNTSPVIGKTIKECKFRTNYGAVVLAVARNSERVSKKIGDIVIQGGDTLLIESNPSFMNQYKDSTDFFLVSSLDDSSPRTYERAWVAIVILLSMVVLAATNLLTMLQASMMAALLMILTRCCTVTQAKKSVDFSVLLIIASALGIGKAIEVSGTSDLLSNSIYSIVNGSSVMSLIAIYIVTSLLTAIITNTAAVALVFPIALVLSNNLGVDIIPFVIVIMMAGSASFATPYGYQTNLMVYGPGGYKFHDYLKIGLPMNVIIGIITIITTLYVFKF